MISGPDEQAQVLFVREKTGQKKARQKRRFSCSLFIQ
jgi:hypothetical protein